MRRGRGPDLTACCSAAAALLALTACGRPPAPTALQAAPSSQPGEAPTVLAGGPGEIVPDAVTPSPDAPPAGAAPAASVATPVAAPAPAASALPPSPAAAAAPDSAEPAIAVIADKPPLDPLQRINRQMFRADRAIDHVLAGVSRPRSRARPAVNALYNLISNLEEPATAANSILQRRPAGAVRAAFRFVINSSLGIAGVFDVADRLGLRRAREDFGRTLAMYGVHAGPYLYLPLLGPSSVRDMAGGMVDGLISPTRLLHLGLLEGRAQTLLKRKVKEAEHASQLQTPAAGGQPPPVDDYALVRARYLHGRGERPGGATLTAQAAAPSMMATLGPAGR